MQQAGKDFLFFFFPWRNRETDIINTEVNQSEGNYFLGGECVRREKSKNILNLTLKIPEALGKIYFKKDDNGSLLPSIIL